MEERAVLLDGPIEFLSSMNYDGRNPIIEIDDYMRRKWTTNKWKKYISQYGEHWCKNSKAMIHLTEYNYKLLKSKIRNLL